MKRVLPIHVGMKRLALAAALVLAIALLSPTDSEAQGRGRGSGEATPTVTAEITISLGDRERIREFYSTQPRPGEEALPPGIRRNLARGKPMPPGLARRSPPQELQSALTLPDTFEIIEVGLDVFLVEVATSIIHDVLMDVIR